MSLVCFGVNHRTAPMALLERVSLTPHRMERLLSSLSDDNAVREVVGLSTCNRTEVYMEAPEPAAACGAVLRHLGSDVDASGLAALEPSFYRHLDDQAAEHLFRVSAGIDSLIIGEAQILGQLRRSFDMARALGTSGENLNLLLERAIRFGRRVRTETAIGRGNVSVASVACRIAVERLGTLADKQVLLLGAGETAQLAGRHFAKEDAGKIRVLNRTPEKAQAMAEELGGEAVPIDQLESAIASADVVVCAVGAPHIIITRKGIGATMAHRPGRPLLMIDLSMPRNIDPEVASLDGVTLFAMENLEEIVRGNRCQRESEIGQVEELVRAETRNYLNWAASAEHTRVVTTLRRQIAAVQQKALERHWRHADPELRQQVELFTDSVMRAALHNVTQAIRTLDLTSDQGRQELEVIKRVFALADPVWPGDDEATAP